MLEDQPVGEAGCKADYQVVKLHPFEKKLIEYIRQLKFGVLELKVQDGLPMIAERVTEKVKFAEKLR